MVVGALGKPVEESGRDASGVAWFVGAVAAAGVTGAIGLRMLDGGNGTLACKGVVLGVGGGGDAGAGGRVSAVLVGALGAIGAAKGLARAAGGSGEEVITVGFGAIGVVGAIGAVAGLAVSFEPMISVSIGMPASDGGVLMLCVRCDVPVDSRVLCRRCNVCGWLPSRLCRR